MLINDASITGSLIVNASASFQNISVGGNIIPDTTNIRNLGSTDKFFKEIYVSTGSINFVDNGSVVAILSAGTINAIQSNTSSANDRLDTIENTTSSLNTFTASISTTNTFTSSATARLNALETTSASVDTLNTNQNNRLGSLETISASNISRISSLETTSASVDTLNTTQNSRLGSLEAKTGSLATTGSNIFYGNQTFTGSVYIKENLIVQGSSSLQNITASAVDIGTNTIILNTDSPAIRFGGISVIDSGSNAGTGSLWWDSQNNHWLYEHPADSGAPYNSAILISGPKNAGNLGEEVGLTSNYIVKAVAGDHIDNSIIFESGSRIGLGTTQPNAMIHTTGSIWITDNPGTNSLIFGSNGSGTAKYAYITSTSEGAQKVGLAMYTTSNAGTSNQERLRITDSGYIGVGTTAPANKLEVFDTQTTIPQFQIKETSSAYHRFGILKSGSFVHFVEPGNDGTSASEYLMTINMNGNNIGIGTSSPSYPLDLYGLSSGTTSTLLRLKNGYNDTSTGLRVRWDFASLPGAYLDVTTDSGGSKSMTLYLSSANGTPSQFLTMAGGGSTVFSNSVRVPNLKINTNTTKGFVNIETSTPWGTASNEVLNFTSYGYDGNIYNQHNMGSINWYSGDNRAASITAWRNVPASGDLLDLAFSTNPGGSNIAERMRIKSDGYVGIGTTNPGDKLHIFATYDANIRLTDNGVSNADWSLLPSTGNSTAIFRLYNRGTATVCTTWTTDGKVGIGTTNPSNKLQVHGNIYSTDTVFGRNLKPFAFASAVAGSPSGATIPLGYSSFEISTVCDGNWRAVMTNINDVKGYFWVTLGDAASKDTANYFMAMTSPAYGVYNFGVVSYQNNGWNTGDFEFSYDSSGGSFRLLVRCTSYYNSANTAYGTIYFLRME